MSNQAKQEFWSSRVGFILATIGSAIGLGSIWKFPYEVGTNGGGTFVLFYLLSLVLVVFPLMLVEFSVGRRGRADAVRSITVTAEQFGSTRHWRLVGAAGILTSFIILSFYSVIGGWALAYAVDTAWEGLARTAGEVKGRFNSLLSSPLRMTAYHAAFMGLTAFIIGRGIAGGIEIACRILMPALMVLITILGFYALIEGDVRTGLGFLFAIRVEHSTAKAALEALGLGFFSIGVGLAVMITYAAHAEDKIDLWEVAIATILGDTVVSFMAGLAVFPIVFAEKLDPAGGPGLVFVTLPMGLAHLPFGTLAATAFFILLVIAALASAVALLEIAVAPLQGLGWTRPFATATSAITCWALGLASVLSFNVWADWFPLASIPAFQKSTIFDLLDYLTSNMLLPACGFALAIFGGWALPARLFANQLHLGPIGVAILRALLRYVAPAVIAAAAFASVRS